MSQVKPIFVQDVVKRYGDKIVLRKVSFSVESGEVVGLLGPNGSGKTTLMRILLGLTSRSSGKVLVMGMDPEVSGFEIRRMVGYVPENVALYESLTPREHFKLAAKIRGVPLKAVTERLNMLIEGFELTKYLDVMVGGLSKGTRQKVAIVLALLHDPHLLILDEPLMGLDAASARLLKEIMRNKARRGGAILLSTHIMEIAERLCDRVVIIHEGYVKFVGTIPEVLAASKSLEDIIIQLTGKAGEIDEIVRALS